MMFKKRISEWYRGKPIESSGPVVFLKSYKQHWTARRAQELVAFCKRAWVIAVMIALIALVYGYRKLG